MLAQNLQIFFLQMCLFFRLQILLHAYNDNERHLHASYIHPDTKHTKKLTIGCQAQCALPPIRPSGACEKHICSRSPLLLQANRKHAALFVVPGDGSPNAGHFPPDPLYPEADQVIPDRKRVRCNNRHLSTAKHGPPHDVARCPHGCIMWFEAPKQAVANPQLRVF